MKNSVKSATKKTSFIDAVLTGSGLELDPRMTQTSQPQTPQTEEQTSQTTETAEVPTVEKQLEEAIKTHLLGVKPNKSQFSKAFFKINGTTKETFNDSKKAIISIFEANNLKTDTYNFIGNYFAEYNGTPYDKGTSNGQTVKAKSEKPTLTKEQQTTLATLAAALGVDSVGYKTILEAFNTELEAKIQVWVKETAESDRKNKSTFVKNFVRSCQSVEFLNSLYELCKNREAEELMFEQNKTEANDDDNKPF